MRSAQEKRFFDSLLEGDEVERFLGQFLPETDAAAADPRLPANIAAVFSDIQQLWQDTGLLSPAETKAALLRKYARDSHPALRALMEETVLSRNAPEPVTGYLGKEHAYIATGLAHLYAKATGQSVSMVDVDFSNMGGTNEHFRRMLAAERGVPAAEIPPRAAEALTDRAVRLLSATIVSELSRHLPSDAKILPIRTGGDELRILVTGLSGQAETNHIASLLHARIEQHVAAMGLQDHPHLKDPQNPVRNGFGAALAIQDMGGIVNTDTVIQELDARISAEKEQLGLLRLGRVDKELLQAQILHAVEAGALPVPSGYTVQDIVNEQIARTEIAAQKTAHRLRTLNPAHNPDLAYDTGAFLDYVGAATAETRPRDIPHAPLPAFLSDAALLEKPRPEALPPFAPMPERRLEAAHGFCAEHGMALSPSETALLQLAIDSLSPVDPAPRTLMPREIIATAVAWQSETLEYQMQIDPHAHPYPETIRPHGMAVSFHNLAGLNSALGHHNADIVLRHMVTDVIGESLTSCGVADYVIAHHGGANFSLLVKPYGAAPEAYVTGAALKQAQERMAKSLAELNGANVAEFLSRKGVHVVSEFKAALTRAGIDTFADIQDPKPRHIQIGSFMLEGRVNGLHVAVAAMPLPEEDAGSFIGALRSQADAAMHSLRVAVLSGAAFPPSPTHAKGFGHG